LDLDFVDIVGPKKSGVRVGLVSFNVKGVHAHDVAQILGERGVAVRAGQHCAHPLHKDLGIMASVRASVGVYNDKNDVDKLIEGLREVQKVFE
jgi:cysteine desulfurase/selenocysteine lyase